MRVGDHRPLLGDDPEAALRRLLPERADRYAQVADATVETGGVPAPDVVEQVLGRVSRRATQWLSSAGSPCRSASGPTTSSSGTGPAPSCPGLLPPTARRAAVVTQATVPFDLSLPIPVERIEIGVGEAHKDLRTVELLARSFARIGLTRHDVVVGVGGGMVTDVAGFAAATWHRGVPVVYAATTLLAMVDAAIGGKTGVNLPEGKNLVGAFWQPSGVICDLDALASLPPRERRSGDGEMAKYHFLTGDDLAAMEAHRSHRPLCRDQGRRRRRRRA